jgi:hypothetical protein
MPYPPSHQIPFSRLPLFLLLLLLLPLLLLPTTTNAQQILSETLTQPCDVSLPRSQQCGGHGQCIAGKCVCDDGWSKNSDFVEVEECQTSEIGLYVLWTINFLENCLVLYQITWVIIARIEHFFETRKTVRGYTLMKNKGLIGVLFFYIFCTPGNFVMIFAKWANPTSRIGFDPLPTSLFFIAKFGLYASGIFLQGPLLSATLKMETRFKRTVQINYIANTIIGCSSMITGGIPFITLMNYQNNRIKQFEIMWAYYTCQAFTLACQAITAFLVFRHVKSVVLKSKDVSSNTAKSEQIIKKVGALQMQIFKQSCVQSLLNIIMEAVPFLMNKHQYFLPISWLAMPLLGRALVLQVDLDRIKAKTLRQRLGFSSSVVGSGGGGGAGVGTGTAGGGGGQIADSMARKGSFNPSPSTAQVVDSSSKTHNKTNNKKNQVRVTSQVTSEMAMEEILAPESSVRDQFTKFVREKFATEALLLYDACVEFEKNAPNASVEERLRMARRIISNYVVENAIKAVDMPHEMRQELVVKSKTGPFEPDSLKQLKNMAFGLLKSNFYNQFINYLEE